MTKAVIIQPPSRELAPLPSGAAGAHLQWTLAEAVDRYLDSLPDKRSANTRSSYRYDLEQLCHWLAGRGIEITGRLAPEDLQAYKSFCLQQERSGSHKVSTINRRLVAVRRWLVWLCAEAAVFDRAPDGGPWLTETRIRQALADIPASRAPKRRELAPTSEEVARLLGVIRHPRDQALFVVLVGAGLRISEALALRPCDLRERQDGAGIIYVAHGKGGKPREVEVAASVVAQVRQWCQRAGKSFGDQSDETTLWPRLKECGETDDQRRPISRWRAFVMLRQYRTEAGITKRFSLHNLRHYYGQAFYEKFADIMRLKDNLGHANLATVQVYVRGAQVETAAPLDVPRPQKKRSP